MWDSYQFGYPLPGRDYFGYRGILIRCRECMHVFLGCRLLVGPVDVAADTLRVCPMASSFGFADLIIIGTGTGRGGAGTVPLVSNAAIMMPSVITAS